MKETIKNGAESSANDLDKFVLFANEV